MVEAVWRTRENSFLSFIMALVAAFSTCSASRILCW